MSRWLGLAASGIPTKLDSIDQFVSVAGRAPNIVNWYESWWWKRAFPLEDAERLALWGYQPQVTWEPWNPDLRTADQPAYKLTEITRGVYDAYITSWAVSIAQYAKPIRIRFAHEMNYTNYPWTVGRNGNTPSDHIAAWLYVQKLFKAAGATNVTWVWCAQTPFPGTVPLSSIYPGDMSVGEVQLDGYNWAMTNPWNSFSGVFKRGIEELTPMTARPIAIGETGCPEVGGDKAAWIRDMWTTLESWPRVRGLLWFNYNKEADWRIDSSPAAAQAFRDGLPRFVD